MQQAQRGGLSTHNMYLSFLLDTGVVGFALFLGLLGHLGYLCFRGGGLAPRLVIILMSFCLIEGFAIETQLEPIFWCVVCVAAAGVLPAERRLGQGALWDPVAEFEHGPWSWARSRRSELKARQGR